ncbi:hypothetical protein Q8F55_001007 [Vanrija albida]|uniref:AAA+ ATPase domain-containing protein n=1 Tax=Vanrija albida TaxID=181172 RepID=A0ABR3QFD2_9TREE
MDESYDSEEVDMDETRIDDSETDSDDDEEYDIPQVVHVEVRLVDRSAVTKSIIESNVIPVLREAYQWVPSATVVPEKHWGDFAILARNVDQIYIAEFDGDVETSAAEFVIHTYRASSRAVAHITGGLDEDDSDTRPSAATICELPSQAHEGLWDSLVYPDDIKQKLLTYIHSSSLFAENEVDFNVVSWNRLILLYGPPGTGKTSLCRALAQKLSIRMSEQYPRGRLVEINSHSLFSKWFSESGKLVQKLFDDVTDLATDEGCLVVVMIDEVESLTAARAGAMTGNEPSDALRVVNALLTQLDKLKSRKNVLVMTTSNLAGSIDSAFVDRADIKQYVGLPPAPAIYWILSSCLQTLAEATLAPGAQYLLKWSDLGTRNLPPAQKKREERARQASYRLRDIADRCYELELSGRFLRKVPLMAHARYLSALPSDRVRLGHWMDALSKAVEDERMARELVNQAEGKRHVKPTT